MWKKKFLKKTTQLCAEKNFSKKNYTTLCGKKIFQKKTTQLNALLIHSKKVGLFLPKTGL
ncbi:hypothetical protein BWK58_09900 [Flavobacterium columnare]|nr:hypothetical protein BWK58_09900 [Flavobacterium columnare]